MEPFWERVDGTSLQQGDYIPDCYVPVFRQDFDPRAEVQEETVVVNEYDLIVVTQSCDLVNEKVHLVALSPICPIAEFEKVNPSFAQKGKWNEVLKGKFEGLHLLASPTEPANNRQALVVDFREIYSLPFSYLAHRAGQLGPRWRLRSPFLEHFSQTFARYFMRVGLPSSIPPYK